MIEVQKRPKSLEGQTYKITTGCGSLYVTVNTIESKAFEVFAKLGKSGGCNACQLEALTRSISLGLRAGIELEEYYDHLKDLQCISPSVSDGEKIKSCPDAIAQVIKNFIPKKEEK
jgi:ribonucleoside-diphosphate reductase alpha chain